jgi:hypothetical protein
MNFGERSQVVVPLNEAGVLRAREHPAELLGDTLEVLAPVGEDR